MHTHRKVQPLSVVGPLGEALTLRTLPARDTKRWIVRRKAEVVAAVRGGLLTVDEACARYRLSPEELASWQHAVDVAGMPGLRVTRTQQYRDLYGERNRRGQTG
ncbi:uncharacterized protein DUF1153 [Hephaestia caeni]|uniref:Uncharacterized protein DUF1153 n=1 Tax=Hephaestia caeni TaxID=645617 RepID=A0A397NVY6_9SPHN|nr:DUF1153 domain-containing protein [Hephaestia caeni]RIA37904.1 uncharacterized protein DUF1153 [Hephaestia caeni]